MAAGVLITLTPRRGVAVATLVSLLTILSFYAFGAVALLLLPVWVLAAWVLIVLLERRSETRNPPLPSPFARRAASRSIRTMLRQDMNARFIHDHHGFMWKKRVWFEATGCPPVWIGVDTFGQLQREQSINPVLVIRSADRRYWWWEENFYWENEGYSSLDVKALILRTRRSKQRQLDHAHALMNGGTLAHRNSIPEALKRAVWRRDGGRCQECGTTELLQYDHIIPWSQGGADTADNLQLLCSECNRLKSDSL